MEELGLPIPPHSQRHKAKTAITQEEHNKEEHNSTDKGRLSLIHI